MRNVISLIVSLVIAMNLVGCAGGVTESTIVTTVLANKDYSEVYIFMAKPGSTMVQWALSRLENGAYTQRVMHPCSMDEAKYMMNTLKYTGLKDLDKVIPAAVHNQILAFGIKVFAMSAGEISPMIIVVPAGFFDNPYIVATPVKS